MLKVKKIINQWAASRTRKIAEGAGAGSWQAAVNRWIYRKTA